MLDRYNSNYNFRNRKERVRKRWTIEEHKKIVRGMSLYGKDSAKLATLVPPRTAAAVAKYISGHSREDWLKKSPGLTSSMIMNWEKLSVHGRDCRKWNKQERTSTV